MVDEGPPSIQRLCTGAKLLAGAAIAVIHCSRGNVFFSAVFALAALFGEFMLPRLTGTISHQHAVLIRPLEEQILNVPFFYLHYQICLREDALSIIETLEDPDERRRYLARQKSVHRLEVFCVYTSFLYRTHIWIHLAIVLVRLLGLPVWPVLCGLAALMLAEHHIWRRDIFLPHIEKEGLMAELEQKLLTMPADRLKVLYWQREDIEKRYF